jgi:hypothetical protein
MMSVPFGSSYAAHNKRPVSYQEQATAVVFGQHLDEKKIKDNLAVVFKTLADDQARFGEKGWPGMSQLNDALKVITKPDALAFVKRSLIANPPSEDALAGMQATLTQASGLLRRAASAFELQAARTGVYTEPSITMAIDDLNGQYGQPGILTNLQTLTSAMQEVAAKVKR